MKEKHKKRKEEFHLVATPAKKSIIDKLTDVILKMDRELLKRLA